jgi:hypothetical protein
LIAADEVAFEAALEAEKAARVKAEAERDEAVVKAETLARKLDGNATRKRTGTTGRKPSRKPATATAGNEKDATASDGSVDLDAEALVLKYLSEGYSASKAGTMAGLTDSRGRQIARKARELSQDAPRDIVDGKEGS